MQDAEEARGELAGFDRGPGCCRKRVFGKHSFLERIDPDNLRLSVICSETLRSTLYIFNDANAGATRFIPSRETREATSGCPKDTLKDPCEFHYYRASRNDRVSRTRRAISTKGERFFLVRCGRGVQTNRVLPLLRILSCARVECFKPDSRANLVFVVRCQRNV